MRALLAVALFGVAAAHGGLRNGAFVPFGASASSGGLPQYNVNTSLITTGGLSAGAFMAIQFHVAFSQNIRGAAVFAGGPFYCAQDALTSALTTCMNAEPSAPDADDLASQMQQFAADGKIDGVGNLTDARVFLYSGQSDSVVNSNVVRAAEELYKKFVTTGTVVGEFSLDSEHCLPTLNYGEDCTQLGSPYLGKCNFDGAGAALKVLYGPDLKPRGTADQANLKNFNQSAYGADASISLNTQGFIYVPTACAKGDLCALHIHFHGCKQSISDIGDAYPVHGGINEWAESNNIIVLYPQAVHSQFEPSNPQGCFDWWGYNGGDYAFKTGAQMKVVHAMVDALTGGTIV